MASLVDHWLPDKDGIRVVDDASVSQVRTRIRSLGGELGDTAFVERCALIGSELATNQVRHAGGGVVQVRALARGGVGGLEIIAADAGPGISPAVFHRTARPQSGSLGAGLTSVERQADEIDFDIRAGEGTCIRARKFAGAAPRRREIAIAGRPLAGEPVSGDHACFWRNDHQLVVCMLDGVGHGQLARDAADAGIEALTSHGVTDPLRALRVVERRLLHQRGAVFSHLALDESTMTATRLGIGNATTLLAGPGGSHRFVNINGVVGQPIAKRRILPEAVTVLPGQIIVMHTDGLTSHVDLTDLFFRSPIAIATQLLETFGRDHDDATVLVIK